MAKEQIFKRFIQAAQNETSFYLGLGKAVAYDLFSYSGSSRMEFLRDAAIAVSGIAFLSAVTIPNIRIEYSYAIDGEGDDRNIHFGVYGECNPSHVGGQRMHRDLVVYENSRRNLPHPVEVIVANNSGERQVLYRVESGQSFPVNEKLHLEDMSKYDSNITVIIGSTFLNGEVDKNYAVEPFPNCS